VLSQLKNLLIKINSPIVNTQNVLEKEDIPRYPPFAKGLPAADTSRLLETQSELILRIKGILRFTPEEFKEIVEPVIENYAAYVHLLPASEAHHHRGAGGLFRHGLEVGFWSAQQAEAHQFCIDESPQKKRDNEPRWQFAAFLGGLLHDVGKPLSDVAVINKEGSTEWNPYESSLASWALDENLDHYFLRWRNKRKKSHEKFSMMNLDQIITQKAKTYLNKPGPKIMESLLESIVGTGAHEALTQIVLWADQESVRRDLINQRMDMDEFSYGVPVERFVFDALRQLAKQYKVNEPGALIWRTDDGVFLVWKKIVPEIHIILDKDKIPGIPRNHDTLAGILIERGFAVPFQEATDEKYALYWNIYPEKLDGIRLICLRVDDLELIFPNEPPPPAKISFNPLSEKESNIQLVQETVEIEKDNRVKQETVSEVNVDKELYQTEKDDLEKEEHVDAAVNDCELDGKKEKNLVIKSNKKQTVTKQQDKKDDHLTSNNEFDMKLYGLDAGPAMDMINKALKNTLKGKKNSILIKLDDGHYAMHYPNGVRQLAEPREVMNVLSDNGLLRVTAISVTKTTTIDGKKYLVLQENVSKYIDRKLSKDVDRKDHKIIKSKKNNEEKKEDKFDNEKMISELISQITKGFGYYIDKDVDVSTKEGKVTYSIDKSSTISRIRDYHEIDAAKMVYLALRMKGFKIKRNKILYVMDDVI